jgi:hypothetical protein
MTNPTYGKPVVQPDDIVARIDSLFPRDKAGLMLRWRAQRVDGSVLIDARNEIQRLRFRVEDLERALKYADCGCDEGFCAAQHCPRAFKLADKEAKP